MKHDKQHFHRLKPALLCVGAIGACLLYAATRSQLPDWWRGYGGGIPYVVFWITFCYAIWPEPRRLMAYAVGCTLATCGLEFLQLWQPPWLTEFRATTFGAALLGNAFTWHDIPPYFIGGVVGYALVWAICESRSNAACREAS